MSIMSWLLEMDQRVLRGGHNWLTLGVLVGEHLGLIVGELLEVGGALLLPSFEELAKPLALESQVLSMY